MGSPGLYLMSSGRGVMKRDPPFDKFWHNGGHSDAKRYMLYFATFETVMQNFQLFKHDYVK